MARPALTLPQAQNRLSEKFPNRDLTLVEYVGSEFPCVIHCPLHGDVRVGSFANVLRSPLGCPTCGKERSRAKLSETAKETHRRTPSFKQLQALLHLPDAQLGAEVRRLLSSDS